MNYAAFSTQAKAGMGGRNREEETDCGFSTMAGENSRIATSPCNANANGMMAWADAIWQDRHLSQGVFPEECLDS